MTATTADTTLRPMRPEDLAAAQALSGASQWPHRLEDWALMCEPGRGLVAEQDGRLVGTVLSWTYGRASAALRMIGVAPDLQGQGIGRRLMQAALLEPGLADVGPAIRMLRGAMPCTGGSARSFALASQAFG